MIDKVTVTGADDSVSPSELFEIQANFPFAEFGILISEKYFTKRAAASRFPSRAWIEALFAVNKKSDKKLNLSCHLCGQWVKDALMGRFDFSRFGADFQRFQLNTHAEPHGCDLDALSVSIPESIEVIFQVDGVNELVHHMRKRRRNVAALFDLSHGAGVLPAHWPMPIADVYCGYAGGLSPWNAKAEIERILPFVGGKSIWIDAETHLRSNSGEGFDLLNVVRFLEAAKPYVKEAK